MEALLCSSGSTTYAHRIMTTNFWCPPPFFSRLTVSLSKATDNSRVCKVPLNHRVMALLVSCSSSRSSLSSSVSSSVETEEGMPIPGTITFRRSAGQTHLEYWTDLNSLGLGKLDSHLSIAAASTMGIRSAVQEDGSAIISTPVSVSIDVSKEGRDLRLDGIVRTALALRCSQCGMPVAERVFADFSLLLTEQPVVEPTKQTLGVVLGDSGPRLPDEGDETDELLDLDLDDKLHFPRHQKTIDISNYIRDTVHLDIPLQCLCSIRCRGVCFGCGVNLNDEVCKCKEDGRMEGTHGVWGPLEQLKKQLQKDSKS